MTDNAVLVEGLKKLSRDVAELAALLENSDASAKKTATHGKETAPAAEQEMPARTYTYEEVRAILAEKARSGYRAEVKALITAHGAEQLSDIKDPAVYTAIAAEAEALGNA